MNIQAVTGLTNAQKATLRGLGAIAQSVCTVEKDFNCAENLDRHL
ncbi:hypothetical protein QUA40_25025 [Microcoleus sp. Pol11C3]